MLLSQIRDHWYPNGLVHDDVEGLLQANCTDVGLPSYDIYSGWGRLNAGLVLENLDWPNYMVKHFNTRTSTYDTTKVASNAKVKLEHMIGDINRGKYKCDIYFVNCTLSHNIGNAVLLSGWVRNGISVSDPYAFSSNLLPYPNAQLTYLDNSIAVISGYVYHIKNKWPNGANIQQWKPFQLGAPGNFAYSLHLYDENANDIQEISLDPDLGLVLFPNPADNSVTIKTAIEGPVKIELFSANGELIQSSRHVLVSDQLIESDVSRLNSGIYFYKLETQNEILVQKFIKK